MTLCISSGMGVAFQTDPEDFNFSPKRHFKKMHKICDFGCKLTEEYYLPSLSIPEKLFICGGNIPENTETISQLNVQFEIEFAILKYLR